MIERVGPVQPTGAAGKATSATTGGAQFSDLLERRLAAAPPVRFSGHALQRLEQRGIGLDDAALARLNEGVGRAAAKGSRDSLVLVDGTGFVVAVPTRTVVTAVDSAHMREQVFTNIDSAVIA